MADFVECLGFVVRARVRSTLAFRAEVADGMEMQWSVGTGADASSDRPERNASKCKKRPQAYLVSFNGMIGFSSMGQVCD